VHRAKWSIPNPPPVKARPAVSLRSRRHGLLDTAGRRYRGTLALRTRCARRPKPPNSAQQPIMRVELSRQWLLRSRRNCTLDTAGRRYRGKITLRTRCVHRPKPPNSDQKPTASVGQSVELFPPSAFDPISRIFNGAQGGHLF
jgi:hypothetical protein